MRSESSYVRDNLRRRCHIALEKQGLDKSLYSFNYVGLDTKELYDYLVWKNFDRKTHTVDHIIPLSRLDLSKESHRQLGFNAYNLQALTPSENSAKHDHLPEDYDMQIKIICKMAKLSITELILKEK